MQQLELPPANSSCSAKLIPILIYFDQTVRETYVRNRPNKLYVGQKVMMKDMRPTETKWIDSWSCYQAAWTSLLVKVEQGLH